MTDTRLSTSISDDPAAMGPLERAECAASSAVLQLGLYAEMQQVRADGQLTADLEEKFATIFASVTEPAQA